MRFEQLGVIHDREPGSAAMNMAIDEALLEETTLPLLRFYRWRQAALSFGYFGRFAEASREAGDRELVRRWTGGGSVPHGQDLTYSLITPISHSVATAAPRFIYAALHRAIRDALSQEGVHAELATAAAPKISQACFANPVTDDVLLNGRKVAGAAQRRTRRGFLHQGSIQLPNIPQSFSNRFARTLGAEIEEVNYSASLIKRAHQLAAEKYSREEWQQRW
jgi:lipoate-protein ligase A